MRSVTPKIKSNKRSRGSLRFILNHLVLLVCCSFLFQALFLINSNAVQSDFARILPAFKTDIQNPDEAWLTNATIPDKASFFLLEANLVTEEDEDGKNTGFIFFKIFSDNFFNNEAGYNSYIKHRFLRINAQVNSHPAIPYFILHHSWKSDLS